MVRVLPDLPAVARQFDYLAPRAVGTGWRVRITLSGRRVGGWVVAADVEPPPGVVPRPVAKVSGYGPPAGVVAVAEWAAWRWAGPEALLLRTASPDRVVGVLPKAPRSAVPSTVPTTGPATAPRAVGPHRTGTAGDAVAEALSRRDRPTVVRWPPATDPLPLVEGVATATGPGALVLVPSVVWAERLRRRLTDRGWRVAGDWVEAAAGWPVVVGARAAAWAPLPGVGAVVVLDAHDEAYREERAPTWNAWEVAAERARRDGAPCVLVSACPTAVQQARGHLWRPSRSLERQGWPPVSVVDQRRTDPRLGLLSEALVSVARRSADAGERLVCVLNRRGRARLLACAACGDLCRCEHCGRALRQESAALRCPGCGAHRPAVCAACGATRLRVLRPGVSRVREELEALLGRPVGEVAGPAAPLPPTDVLIGTEAVLHRVRRAGAVVFLDVDQHLLAPRFAAGEEALALLARAARLVAAVPVQPGVVVLQTRVPDHPVIEAAVHADPGRIDELGVRRDLSLPPFAALALLSGPAAGEHALRLADDLDVRDLGDGRWLVRAGGHDELCDALAGATRPKGPLRVEVDPTGI